jgi:tetratricopeptide (TPR) repeat protein
MPDETAARRKSFEPRRLAVPLVSLIALFAAWQLDLRWLMLPIGALVVAYYFALPRLVRSREERFHRQALRLLATGKAAAVPELARRQLVLQLFGTTGPIDAILGLAYAKVERWASAAEHLEPAIAAATGPDHAMLRANLTKALFAKGALDRARDEGTSLMETGLKLPETLVLVARSYVGIGRADARVGSLLDEAESLSPSDDVRTMIELTRIEARLATGRKVPPLADDADSGQRFVRAWIHFVRGRLREHRGDVDGAAASYGKAEREAGEEIPVFSALAHERLGIIAGSRTST